MIRLTNSFIQVRRSGRLTIFLLLFVLLSAATAGLTTTLKGPDLGSLWQSLLFGLLMGWMLTDFHFSAGRAIWMGLTLGTIYILLFPASLLGTGNFHRRGIDSFRMASHCPLERRAC